MKFCARIVRHQYADRIFDGTGASMYGGRWNEIGIPMVYFADSIALAAVEVLVHIQNVHTPIQHVCAGVRVPNRHLEVLPLNELPANWQSAHGMVDTARIGSAWVRAATSLALLVPSVIIPRERVVLINPKHRKAQDVVLDFVEPFSFDRRFSTGL